VTRRGITLLERLQHLEKVLHDREGLVEVVQQGSPLGVLLRAAEPFGVGLDGVPFDEQQVEVRGLDRSRQGEADEAGPAADQRFGTGERGLELRLQAGTGRIACSSTMVAKPGTPSVREFLRNRCCDIGGDITADRACAADPVPMDALA